MVFVVLSGLSLDVDPTDLAEKINSHFGQNKEIGTFRMIIDDSDVRKPKAVLKFKQGFDAMEAQRLLDNFKYADPDDNMIYNIKALVPTNDQPYLSLFSEENPDIADVIKAEKQKRKKEKKAKKRKHSPVDEDLTDRFDLSKQDLEAADIKKLEKLCKELKKKKEKAEKRSSQSEHSTSESESKKKKRDKSIHGESSGVSKRPKSPVDLVPKYKGQSTYGECSKNTPKITTLEQTRSTNDSPKSSDYGKEIPKRYKIPRKNTSDDTGAKIYDSRKINIDKMDHRRSESQSSDEKKSRFRSELYDPSITKDKRDYSSPRRFERAREDLRHKVEARRASAIESRTRDYGRDHRDRAHRDSPRRTGPSQEGKSDKDRRSSNESIDSEFIKVPELLRGKKLLLLEPSHYLDENDTEFKEAVAHIIHTVAANMERLQEDDKKLIIENYTETVVTRLKNLKFTTLMSVQDIVLDYKLVYKTTDDKLLINKLIEELQALGKGVLLPEIKKERLGQAIDEVLETTNIDELMEDIKPEIKEENTLEYEYEDGEMTEVINIVVNLIPIEKRALPVETDPDKITDIKVFVSKLKKTKPNKFFRPIRSLLNEMKLFIYKNAKVVPSEVILNRMVEVLEKMLARMLGPVKTRVKSKHVCNLFRNSFPYKEDKEFVDMIIKWILDGEFDKGGIDVLICDKIVLPKLEKTSKTEKENCPNEQILVKPIKSEPLDTPVKEESANNRDMKETTNTTETVGQKSKDLEMNGEKRANVCEIVDDDVIIKKEPVDVIMVEDDDVVTKTEPIDHDNGTCTIKLETMSISDSEDGALSDDSTTTQIIEPKPFDVGYMGNDPAMLTNNVTGDIYQGVLERIKNEPEKSDKAAGEPGEILDGPVNVFCEPGKILDKPVKVFCEPGKILDGPVNVFCEPGEIFNGPGETIDDIRQYLKSEED